MSRPARHLLPGILACLAALPLQAAAPRVVSMHLCSDQLLLELAAPGQILSLSHLSADPVYSPIADRVAGYDFNRGQAEEVLPLAPDLVLTGAFSTTLAANLLERQGLEILRLGVTNSVEEQYTQFRDVAARLGTAERAEALIAAMQARLDALVPPLRAQLAGKRAVFYSSNGYSYGRDTLQHAFITSLGMHNVAEHLAGPAPLALERLVVDAPDFIIINQNPALDPPLAHALLQHPALAASESRYRLIELPDALFQCASPDYATAYAAFGAQL